MIRISYFLFFLLLFFNFSQGQETMSSDFSRGFIPNQGQFSNRVGDTSLLFAKFTDAQGRELWITPEGLRILKPHGSQETQEQRICFSDRPLRRQQVFFEDPLPHHFNYFYPHCPQGIYGVKAYRNVRIKNVVPGFDLLLSLSKAAYIEQKIVPGGSTTPIDGFFGINMSENRGKSFQKDSLQGVHAFSLDDYVYVADTILPTDFIQASLTANDALTLKNTPHWGTYWSGSPLYPKDDYTQADFSYDSLLQQSYFSLTSSTTDSLGNIYLVGKDKSVNFIFPTTDTTYARSTFLYGSDAFIAKCDVQGRLQWMTYYGSTMNDEARVIKLNSKNEIYVGGNIVLPLYPHLISLLGCDFGLDYSMEQEIGPPLASAYTYWKNDFPVHGAKGYLSSDTGSLFLLKFTTTGERLWAGLYGPNQISSDSIAVLTRPDLIEIDNHDQVYLVGSFVSHQYYTKNDTVNIKRGKMLPVFGPIGAFLCSADTLPKYWGTDGFCHYTLSRYDHFQTQFLLKLNSREELVWSTYLPARSNIRGLKADSKRNLYFHGLTHDDRVPPLLKKEGAYFAHQKFERYDEGSTVESSYTDDVNYLAQIDSNGIFRWCTHIDSTTQIAHNADYVNPIYNFELLITEDDHVLITGGTNNMNYPSLYLSDAFYLPNPSDFFCPYYPYITEFDEQGKMIWSTCLNKKSGSVGYNLCSDLNGGFYVLSLFAYTNSSPIHDTTGMILSHFDKKRRLIEERTVSAALLPYSHHYGKPETPISFVIGDWESFRQVDAYNLNLYHTTPSLKTEVSPWGYLYITGNAFQLPSYFLTSPNKDSYFQPRTLYTDTDASKHPFSGFILSYDLCDTNSQFSVFTDYPSDSLYCAPLLIPLSVSDTVVENYSVVWNAGTENESVGRSYTIIQPGTYFVEARHKYPSCPTIYSDTIRVDTLPPPLLHFPQDTVKRCVGEGVYAIHATNPQSTYLWSDGSTDSVYLLRYTDTPIISLSCTVTNVCGAQVSDTITVEFLPPYAYLGKDTVLCKGDSLLLDMEKLNANLPATLQYVWFLNGNQVEGIGPEQGQYLITSKDSGTLMVEVYWMDADCRVAKDTLEFSYYPYPDVAPHIEDTTICMQTQALFNAGIEANGPDAFARWYNSTEVLLSEADSIFLSEEGVYTVELQNYCSRASDSFALSYYPLWWTNLVIPSDTFKCEDQPIVLDVRINKHPTIYQWGDESLPSSGVRTFDREGEYEITLTDSMGCSQSHTIHLRSEECSPVLEIPNVFTPNNDGINDVLKVKTQEQVYDFKMQIFTSWGLKVYEYSGEADAWQWDGNTKGSKALPDGAYFWVALFKNYKGEKKKETGCVMILR